MAGYALPWISGLNWVDKMKTLLIRCCQCGRDRPIEFDDDSEQEAIDKFARVIPCEKCRPPRGKKNEPPDTREYHPTFPDP